MGQCRSNVYIEAIPILKDNYVWVMRDENNAVIVDPGDAKPVINYLQCHNLQLAAILITHHHADHIGGVAELLAYQNVAVYAPHHAKNSVASNIVQNDTVILIDKFPTLKTIEIPGHTLDHVAYYFDHHLFCGDTLFSAGCGRVFEGTYEQMYQSLQKIKSLPPDTKIYCTHEYTLQNLKFALVVEPENTAIKYRISTVSALRKQNQPSLPTTLGEEFNINPFLRCEVSVVIAAAEKESGKKLSTPVDVFSTLRQWKNNFTS